MGKKKKRKSNYKKARARAIEHASEHPYWLERLDALEHWFAKVPWKYMSPEGKERFEEFVVEPAREEVLWRPIEDWVKRRRPWLVETGRWRPVYDRMLDYIHRIIVRSPETWAEIVEAWLESPTKAYRMLASLPDTPSTSWRVWANLFSFLQLGAFPWKRPPSA